MHCTNCGKEIPDGSKFCDKCGSPVAAPIFCSNCGTQNRAGAVVCSKCGARMAGAPPAAAPAPQYTAPPVAAPAPQYAAPVTGVSGKSRLVAGLLCFFLGQIGAHRFYTGKTGTAIVQLLLFVVGYTMVFIGLEVETLGAVGTVVVSAVGLWLFIDFITILVGKFKDKNGLYLKK
jgi:TM2 domain-containing membrane protein YozV